MPDDDLLVHQSSLDRRLARRHEVAQLRRGQVERVGAEALLVGIEQHPTEAPRIADPQLSPAVEGERDPIPVGVLSIAAVLEVLHAGHAVDEQATRHPEPQPDRRAVIVGVDEKELASAPYAGDRAPDDRLLEHRRGEAFLQVPRVRGHHLRDPTTDRALRGAAVELDLEHLGHGAHIIAAPMSDAGQR